MSTDPGTLYGGDPPSVRSLVVRAYAHQPYATPRRVAMWIGQPAADVRAVLAAMEAEGRAVRWHEQPGDEWRWALTKPEDSCEGAP